MAQNVKNLIQNLARNYWHDLIARLFFMIWEMIFIWHFVFVNSLDTKCVCPLAMAELIEQHNLNVIVFE